MKGASSVLFGGGSGATAGGLVNIVSKTPEPDAFGRVGVTAGADGRINPLFDLNRPLTEHVLFRVTGEDTREDPEFDVIETDRFAISPTLKAEGTSFTLQCRYSRWRQPEYQGLPATGTVAGRFRIDRKTLAVTDTATLLSVANGEERSQGFDADLVCRISPELSLIGRYAYVDAEFTEDAPTLSGVIPAGNELAGVPKHSGRLWLEYAFPQPELEGLRLGAGVAAGVDFGLKMLEALRARDYAMAIRLLAQYDPAPPFDAGSLASTPPHVSGMMRAMFPGFVQRAVEAGRAARAALPRVETAGALTAS